LDGGRAIPPGHHGGDHVLRSVDPGLHDFHGPFDFIFDLASIFIFDGFCCIFGFGVGPREARLTGWGGDRL